MDKKSTLYIVKTEPIAPDKEAFKSVFAARLKDAREDTIFSQGHVGAVIGKSATDYSKYERGLWFLPAAFWEPVCEKLYIDPWQLLTGRPLGKTPSLPAHLRNKKRRIPKQG